MPEPTTTIGTAEAITDDPGLSRNDRLAWLQLRQQGIGGSDVAKLLGIYRAGHDEHGQPIDPKPDESPHAVYHDKVDPVDDEEQALSDNIPASRGLALEDYAAALYEELTGLRTKKVPMMRHRKRHWQLGNADRLVYDSRGGLLRGLELKCPSTRARAWHRAKDEPPPYVVAQCQWYMDVTGFDAWDVFALIDVTPKLWTIPRDEEFILRARKECHAFWLDHVEPRIPPPPADHEVKAWIAERWPAVVQDDREATADESAVADRIVRCERRIGALRRRKKQLEAELLREMPDVQRIWGDGWSFTHRPRAGKVAWRDVAEDLARQVAQLQYDAGGQAVPWVRVMQPHSAKHTGEPTTAAKFNAKGG